MRTFFTITLSLLLFHASSQPLLYDFVQSEGGIATADSRNDVVKDSNGNLIVMGDFSGTRTFGTTSITAKGNTEIFVAKFNPNGGLIWVVNGGDSLSFANSGGVTVDNNDNVYITGKYLGNFGIQGTVVSVVGNSDIFIAKINGTSGNLSWLRTAGGNSIDEGFDIAHVGNNQVVVTGAYAGSADFGSLNLNSGVISNINIFAAKYNASGIEQWVVDGGGSSEDKGFAVTSNDNGDVYVAGTFQGSNSSIFGTTLNSSGSSDLFLAKLNSTNGNAIWVKKAGGSGLDEPSSISANTAGDVFITGLFYSTATFGSLSISEASMAGDMFIVKYDNQGTALWVKKGGGSFQDKGNGCSAEPDASGSVYVTGSFAGTSNFSGQSLSASGPTDVFIAKYNSMGDLTYVEKGGGSSSDQGKAVVANSDGTFCFVGSFNGTAAFGSNSVTAAAGVWETFVACADGGTVGITESFENAGLHLLPNPVSDKCVILFDNAVDGTVAVRVYDLLGTLIIEKTVQENKTDFIQLETDELITGMYMVYIETKEHRAATKLIKK